MTALKHTVASAYDLCMYLFNKCNLHYVLLGKFQTDNLEFRFSQYRQMSGANYHVSVTQVMESEKKLRIMSVMKVVNCAGGVLTIRDFITGCQKEAVESNDAQSDSSELAPFLSVISDCDDVIVSETEMSGIVFIAGYVGYKLKAKLSCIDCRLELLTDRALECDFPRDDSFDYMAGIDRGGLTWPTDLLVDIVAQTIIVFKCLVSSNHTKNFTSAQKQRSIMSQLASQRCDKVCAVSAKCQTCGVDLGDIAKICIKIVCNISLNNYTKRLGDGKSVSKTLSKLSTLTK